MKATRNLLVVFAVLFWGALLTAVASVFGFVTIPFLEGLASIILYVLIIGTGVGAAGTTGGAVWAHKRIPEKVEDEPKKDKKEKRKNHKHDKKEDVVEVPEEEVVDKKAEKKKRKLQVKLEKEEQKIQIGNLKVSRKKKGGIVVENDPVEEPKELTLEEKRALARERLRNRR